MSIDDDIERDRIPIAATDKRDVDWVDVTGWGVFKNHAIPVDVARFIAEKINLYVKHYPQPASAGPVVALEWTEQAIPPTGECLAYSPVGLYCIPLGRTAFSVRFRDKGEEDGPYPTLDAAKAAAQADFERRILSALAPSIEDPTQ